MSGVDAVLRDNLEFFKKVVESGGLWISLCCFFLDLQEYLTGQISFHGFFHLRIRMQTRRERQACIAC